MYAATLRLLCGMWRRTLAAGAGAGAGARARESMYVCVREDREGIEWSSELHLDIGGGGGEGAYSGSGSEGGRDFI